PSDKVNLAYIGCGTQGLREMCDIIVNPELQILSVCDPNKFTTNYVDWSPHGIRDGIREVLGDPTWGEKLDGIPGGRDIGKELVEKYYGKAKNSGKYKGCTAYADFRELLEKEKDIDAVKIMTPDHLHGYISVAAMNKGKHVVIHKPLANRMHEARLVIDTAKKTGVTGPCGRSGRAIPPTHPRCPKGLTGTCGWDPCHIAHTIRITPTMCSAGGTISEGAVPPTWDTTASGRCSFHLESTRRQFR